MSRFSILKNEDSPCIKVGQMECDIEFSPLPPEPCPTKSFCWCVVGSRGSGKSSYVRSILSSKRGKSRVYYKCFHSVLVVMPEQSRKSMTPNPFKGLPEEDMFENFDEEAMTEIEDEKSDAGIILQEVQAGYMFGERLLRPALVGVSKKKN